MLLRVDKVGTASTSAIMEAYGQVWRLWYITFIPSHLSCLSSSNHSPSLSNQHSLQCNHKSLIIINPNSTTFGTIVKRSNQEHYQDALLLRCCYSRRLGPGHASIRLLSCCSYWIPACPNFIKAIRSINSQCLPRLDSGLLQGVRSIHPQLSGPLPS
jgi:hypothetical protein